MRVIVAPLEFGGADREVWPACLVVGVVGPPGWAER